MREITMRGNMMLKLCFFILLVFSVSSCGYLFYEDISFEDENGKVHYVFNKKKYEEILYGFGIYYLHNDAPAWTSHDNKYEYYQELTGKYSSRIYIGVQKGYKVKHFKLRILGTDGTQLFSEDGVFYDGKYPVVRFDSLKDFFEKKVYESESDFYIDVFYDENKIKNLREIIIDVACIFEYKGEEIKAPFNVRLYRKTRILNILDRL